MASQGIEIRDLYKIFGPNGKKYIEAVKDGISKTELNEKHGHVLGLNNINISMPAGKIQVVMGLSGSGKSTLIRHINRLIEPTVGNVLYEDVDVCEMSVAELQDFRRHKTAMVFQKFALFPHRTVLNNTSFVFGNRTEGAAAKTATHNVYRKTDHLIRWNFLAFVLRVRRARERHGIYIIHFIRGEWNGWRV